MAELTTTPTAPSAAVDTLWRCGGRDCGAGECEHDENALHRAAIGEGPGFAPRLVHDVLRGTGNPLPQPVRREMEELLGHDFGDVRVHTDARAARSADAVSAHAYTVGRHMVFGPGEFDPAGTQGRRLLAHELTHAAANPGGLGVPTGPLRVSSPDEPAERRAARNVITESFHGAHRLQRQKKAAATPAFPCDPVRALTWKDYTGTVPKTDDAKAATSVDIADVKTAGGIRLAAQFQAKKSWAKPIVKTPANRTANGCQETVNGCIDYLNRKPGEEYSYRGLPSTDCPDAVLPGRTVSKNAKDCDKVLGAACDKAQVEDAKRLLHHEQGHLDLVCALVKKANALIDGGTAITRATVKDVADKTIEKYDDDTKHGCVADQQAAWDKEFAAGLPKVSVTGAAAATP